MKKIVPILGMIVMLCLTSFYCDATIITVTNSNNDGPGSFRQAVLDANSGDQIQFSAATNGNTIVLQNMVTVDKHLTITGNGISNTILDGGLQDRVMLIPSGWNVSLSGLIIQRGRLVQNGAVGGGIRAQGNLTMIDCWVRGNEAVNYNLSSQSRGGGIANSGDLVMTNCVVSGNFALTEGGGIYSSGTVTLINASVVGNSTLNFTTPTGETINSYGGGLSVIGLPGVSVLNIRNSIVWDNYSITSEQMFVSNPTVDHSIVEGLDLTTQGTGNLNGTYTFNTPEFIQPLSISGTASIAGDFRLNSNSQLIDKGNNSYNSETSDIRGYSRTFDGDLNGTATIDLGAYEFNNFPGEFITVWKTDNPGLTSGNQIRIPADGLSTNNYNVDWGDGTTSTNVTDDITHTYDEPGTYTVTITGLFPRIVFNNSGDRQKILSVVNWGDNPWTDMSSAFEGCTNLTIDTPFPPNLSNVTNTSEMFKGASSVNENFEHWDMSNVISTVRMFQNATSFNGQIENWDVGNVFNFIQMFNGATSFNRNIGGWNTGSATDMTQMFNGATVFNQNIGNWNTSGVENFNTMFRDATAFNQDIGNWDVGNAVSLAQMFYNATSFDQDLGDWDISSLDGFNIPASVELAVNMFTGTALSVENYDNLLIGWSTLNTAAGETSVPNNVTLGAGMSQYCNGAAARAYLVGAKNWTISDGGSLATTSSFSVSSCGSYTVPSGDETYSISGIYLDTLQNVAGCDSIMTIDVTINEPVNVTDVVSTCDPFTWIDGNLYTESNNTATFNFEGGAANGCDSLVTLDLTVLTPATGTDTNTACASFTWIDGNTYSESNNTAQFNIVGGAVNGCDSLVTLNLTILDCTPNNECSDAITLAVPVWPAVSHTLGTLYQATNTGTSTCTGANGGDVYYSFTATSFNHYFVTVNPIGGFDAVVQVLEACGGTEVACFNNAGAGGVESDLLLELPAGDFVVRVQNLSGSIASSSAGNFLINVQSFPTAQVQANPTNFLYACNTTNRQLEDIVGATPQTGQLAGILDYEWYIERVGGGFSNTWVRGEPNYSTKLTWLGMQNGETYNVYVRMLLNIPGVGPVWGVHQIQGGMNPEDAGASTCTISTSGSVTPTEVRPQYTPTNLQGNAYSMCNVAVAYTVANAENYEWEFDNGVDPAVYYLRGAGNPSVKLSWVNCLKPNNTYQVRVRAQVDGDWGSFGTAYPMDMAPTANTALRSNICGSTRALTQFLLPNPVCIADSYTYELVNTLTSDVHTATSTNTAGSVLLNTFSPALVPGATYSVRVKATQCSEEGDYSTACNITIAGPQAQGDETPALRTLAENSATLYPNPNTGTEVRVELSGLGDGNHEVMIQIYDVFGKLIQTEGFGHNGSAMSRLVRFDGNMAMGMYMVQIVVDGERFATERMVIN